MHDAAVHFFVGNTPETETKNPLVLTRGFAFMRQMESAYTLYMRTYDCKSCFFNSLYSCE